MPKKNNSVFWDVEVAPRWAGIEPVYQFDSSEVQVMLGYIDGQKILDIFGEDAAVIDQLAYVKASFDRPDLSTMPKSIPALLDEETRDYFGPSFGWDWDFYYTETSLRDVDGTENVELLDCKSSLFQRSSHEIYDALRQANPISDALEHFEELSWFIIREDSGIACVLGFEKDGDKAYLHGLGTSPAYRGRGYAQAIMVGATNQLLHTNTMVYFSMWGWNSAARQLYSKIGVQHGAELTHGRREPFTELNAQW